MSVVTIGTPAKVKWMHAGCKFFGREFFMRRTGFQNGSHLKFNTRSASQVDATNIMATEPIRSTIRW